jgi:hypothetical protein
MDYFLDTEFIERPNTIELISIGLVAMDNREYYAVHTECDCAHADPWVKENVLKKIQQYNVPYNDLRSTGGAYDKKTITDIRNDLITFCGQKNNVTEQCKFYGYFSDYDWVIFCWIFGKMINLPKGFPKYCVDLKQTLDEKAHSMKEHELCKNFDYEKAKKHFPEGTLIKDPVVLLKGHKEYPEQNNEHNALEDAKWNKELWHFLNYKLERSLNS